VKSVSESLSCLSVLFVVKISLRPSAPSALKKIIRENPCPNLKPRTENRAPLFSFPCLVKEAKKSLPYLAKRVTFSPYKIFVK